MKQRFSPEVFAAAFSILYVAVLAANLPLFLYYPQEKLFSWGWRPLTQVGPGMVWYGLLAVSLPAAALLALIVPARIFTPRVRGWLWIFPICAMMGCAYLMRQYFVA
jgi:hypothetical protein